MTHETINFLWALGFVLGGGCMIAVIVICMRDKR